MKVVIKFFIILYLVILKSSVGYASDESIKIGLLAPLSGEYSNIGKSIIQSSKMGINKIDDSKILILPRDTNASNVQTLKKVESLYEEGVRIFIGPVFNKNLSGLNKFDGAVFLSLIRLQLT